AAALVTLPGHLASVVGFDRSYHELAGRLDAASDSCGRCLARCESSYRGGREVIPGAARVTGAGCAAVMFDHTAVAQNGAEVPTRQGNGATEGVDQSACNRFERKTIRRLALRFTERVSGLRHVGRRQGRALCRERVVAVRVPHDREVAADLADQLVALRHVR